MGLEIAGSQCSWNRGGGGGEGGDGCIIWGLLSRRRRGFYINVVDSSKGRGGECRAVPPWDSKRNEAWNRRECRGMYQPEMTSVGL